MNECVTAGHSFLGLVHLNNVQFQKISILSPQKGLEFPGGGGSLRPKHLKKGIKLNWNF